MTLAYLKIAFYVALTEVSLPVVRGRFSIQSLTS